jgi:hypothetical protein
VTVEWGGTASMAEVDIEDGASATVAGNWITGNRLDHNRFFGIAIQDGDGRTDGNVVIGGQVGIGVVADFIDTTAVLTGDRITGTSVAPVKELDCCGVTATAIVRRF